MDVQRTMEFILEQQAAMAARQEAMDRRQEAQQKKIDAILKLIQAGMKWVAKHEQTLAKHEEFIAENSRQIKGLLEAQKATDKKLDRLLEARMRRPSNGRSKS
jgi:hypothetical protein